MKKITVFLLLVFCLGLTGCSKNAEVQAFITELDSTTKEMVGKLDASPNSQGVDEAQKAFDAKKASLKEKFDAFKNARGFQVSEDMQKKLVDSATNNAKLLSDTVTKHASEIANDGDGMQKVQKLMKDYTDTFKM
ncbi:MAG: hypothetical protein JSS81_06870 [Acidobacteria bacterium]|nr:hypothetical protein [Acidobacteriota bacterium]